MALNMTMPRSPYSYNIFIVTPLVLTTSTGIIALLLHPAVGERASVVVTMLLAVTAVMWISQDMTPKLQGEPVFSVLCLVSFSITTLTFAEGVVVCGLVKSAEQLVDEKPVWMGRPLRMTHHVHVWMTQGFSLRFSDPPKSNPSAASAATPSGAPESSPKSGGEALAGGGGSRRARAAADGDSINKAAAAASSVDDGPSPLSGQSAGAAAAGAPPEPPALKAVTCDPGAEAEDEPATAAVLPLGGGSEEEPTMVESKSSLSPASKSPMSIKRLSTDDTIAASLKATTLATRIEFCIFANCTLSYSIALMALLSQTQDEALEGVTARHHQWALARSSLDARVVQRHFQLLQWVPFVTVVWPWRRLRLSLA